MRWTAPRPLDRPAGQLVSERRDVAVHDDPRVSDGRATIYLLPDAFDDTDERRVRGLPARQPTRAS